MADANIASWRSERFEEYFKLTDVVHNYDDYFLRIKTWGVTISGTVLGLGLNQKSWPVLLASAVLGIGFWATEIFFKLLQVRHFVRVAELEADLQANTPSTPSPRIFSARLDGAPSPGRVLKTTFVPHVMLPHVFVVLAAAISSGVLYH